MSEKITFSELVDELADKTGTTQTLSHDFVSALTNLVVDTALDEGKAAITNFGSFTVVDVAARNGVNPQTGESIVIPAHQRLSFSPYKALENSVNAPYSDLEATVIEENEEVVEEVTTDSPEAPVVVAKLVEDEPEETEKVVTPVYKRPGKEEEKVGNLQNIILLILLLLVVLAGLWFFIFRDSSEPEIAEQTPPPVETTPPAQEEVVENSVPEHTPPIIPDIPAEENQEEQNQESPAEETINVTTSSSAGSETYVVSQDEWIYDIARKTYNNPTFWPLIFEANFPGSQDPDLIMPGRTLNIPMIENTQNPTDNDRERLASAHRVVSRAYADAGKSESAENYKRMAARFDN